MCASYVSVKSSFWLSLKGSLGRNFSIYIFPLFSTLLGSHSIQVSEDGRGKIFARKRAQHERFNSRRSWKKVENRAMKKVCCCLAFGINLSWRERERRTRMGWKSRELFFNWIELQQSAHLLFFYVLDELQSELFFDKKKLNAQSMEFYYYFINIL